MNFDIHDRVGDEYKPTTPDFDQAEIEKRISLGSKSSRKKLSAQEEAG